MKKVMLVLGVLALMGGTWFAAGHYYSNENQVKEVSYKFAQYELNENPFLAELSQPKQTSLLGEAKGFVKAMIKPVRAYFSDEEEAAFKGVKLIKVGGCSYSSSNSISNSFSSEGSSTYATPSTSHESSTFSFNDHELIEPSYLETQPTYQNRSGGGFLFNRTIQH